KRRHSCNRNSKSEIADSPRTKGATTPCPQELSIDQRYLSRYCRSRGCPHCFILSGGKRSGGEDNISAIFRRWTAKIISRGLEGGNTCQAIFWVLGDTLSGTTPR